MSEGTDFSAATTAFSGYGLIKRKPGLFVALAVFGILVGLAIAALSVAIAGPQMAALQAMRDAQKAGGPRPDPQATLALLGPILQFGLLMIPVSLVTAAINGGAVNRAVVRAKSAKFPFLAVGADEGRLFVTFLVLALVIGLPAIVLLIIGQIVTVTVMFATIGRGGLQAMAASGHTPPAVLATTLIVYSVVGVLAFLWSARFSLAQAQTVAERGVRIFGSWSLTTGRYWKVVGTLLLSLISLIPVVAIAVVIDAGVRLSTGGKISDVWQPDNSTMAAVLAPAGLVHIILTGVAGAVAVMVTTGAAANIYRAVTGGAESVFSDDTDDDENWDDE